jgi:phage tail sheath protein FI
MTGKSRGRKRRTWFSPGVYVEEVASGSKPIEGVGTSIAAFVGLAPPNPVRAAAALLVVAVLVGAVLSRRGR